MKDNNNKTLMYAISNTMSKPEAISFAQILNSNEKYYLIKVSENPKARHLAKRERYVVVKDLRKGEIVPNGNALFADKRELQTILN